MRDLNNAFLTPLQPVFPAHRLGKAMGDAPKVNCATCHNGVFKPLFGQAMAKDFPSLRGPAPDGAAPARATEAAPAAETSAN